MNLIRFEKQYIADRRTSAKTECNQKDKIKGGKGGKIKESILLSSFNPVFSIIFCLFNLPVTAWFRSICWVLLREFINTKSPTALYVELNETANNEATQRSIILTFNNNAHTKLFPAPSKLLIEKIKVRKSPD